MRAAVSGGLADRLTESDRIAHNRDAIHDAKKPGDGDGGGDWPDSGNDHGWMQGNGGEPAPVGGASRGRRRAMAAPAMSRTELAAFRGQVRSGSRFRARGGMVIRDYFQDRPGRRVRGRRSQSLRDSSKTYYLESKLGWSGLAIDRRASSPTSKALPAEDEVPAVLRLRRVQPHREAVPAPRKDQVASSNEAFVKSIGGAGKSRRADDDAQRHPRSGGGSERSTSCRSTSSCTSRRRCAVPHRALQPRWCASRGCSRCASRSSTTSPPTATCSSPSTCGSIWRNVHFEPLTARAK